MKTQFNSRFTRFILKGIFLLLLLPCILLSQEKQGTLSQIIIYKGEKPGTGPGISIIKMTVGEEIIVTAKGVDADGNEISICPTWKADKELSIKPIEGKGKSVIIKAEKESISAFFQAIYITDEGKKVSGEGIVEIKGKK